MGWAFFVFVGVVLLWSACVGLIFNRRNVLIMLLCVELIFLAAGINFVLFSKMYHDYHGHVMALLVLVVAACESAIALALVVLMYRQYDSLDARYLTKIEG